MRCNFAPLPSGLSKPPNPPHPTAHQVEAIDPDFVVELEEPQLEEFDPEEYAEIEREMLKELKYYLEPPTAVEGVPVAVRNKA